MDNCVRRFPVVGKMILKNLDNFSLVTSKEISKEVSKFMEKKRFYWLRIIKKFPNDWIEDLDVRKAPIKDLKKMAIEAIESEKSYWIDIIEGYKQRFVGHKEAWKELIQKIPINVVKQLAIAVEQFCKPWLNNIAPLIVAVENGSLELFKYVISKTRNKNPTRYGKTTLHKAATNGHLEI